MELTNLINKGRPLVVLREIPLRQSIPMNYLKQARRLRKLSQSEVCKIVGISRAQLYRLESGQQVVAAPEVAKALRDLLGIAVLEARQVLPVGDRADICPFDLESVNPLPWRVAWTSWGSLGIAARVREWMSQFLPADSACECSALSQLVAAGAEPLLGSPHQWGFDLHPVVDGHGRLLGARVLAGLSYQRPGLQVALWPQVRLRVDDRHCYRVDALMDFRLGRLRRWLVLEFDGEGHQSSGDTYRSNKLGLPEVRISGREIRQNQTLARLLQRAEGVVKGP